MTKGKFANGVFAAILIVLLTLVFFFFLLSLGNVVWRGLPNVVENFLHPEIQYAIKLSVLTSVLATCICFFFALPAAYALERMTIPGKRFINIILNIPISLPPLVSGVALLLLFAYTFVGDILKFFGIEFIFSIKGIVLAQFFITTPYMIRILRTTFAGLDPRYEFVARTLGLNRFQAFARVTVPLCKNGIVSSIIVSWSRAIGEFGCSLMVAGATRMKTETLPVAIYLNMSVGNLDTAMSAAICLVIISCVTMFVFETVTCKGEKGHGVRS